MVYLELKEYGLRFIRDTSSEIGIGTLVGLYGDMPTYRTEMGYVIEMRDEDGIKLYGIIEIGDSSIYWYDRGSLSVIMPILVSDDEICIDDLFYSEDGGVHRCSRVLRHRVYDMDGNEYDRKRVSYIISLSSELGYSISEGLLIDDGIIWKLGGDSVYLEEYSPIVLKTIVLNDMRVSVVVNEVCIKHGLNACECLSGLIIKPVLYNGKIIMDSHKLIKRGMGYYFH